MSFFWKCTSIQRWYSELPILKSYQFWGCAFRFLNVCAKLELFSQRSTKYCQNCICRDWVLVIDTFFMALAQSFGRSTILNFGAGSLLPIFQISISIKKNAELSSVCWLSHSIAFLCSSQAFLTIHIITSASFPDAYVIIFPKWSWLVSSNWFSITTFLPVPSSVANKSTLKSPTLDSCSSKTSSMPIASLNAARFSSLASQGVKSFASCFQIERKSVICSNLPNFMTICCLIKIYNLSYVDIQQFWNAFQCC